MGNEDFEESLKRANNLEKISSAIQETISGLEYNEKLAILQTVMTREISDCHEYQVEVISEMTRIFISMVMSYSLVNNMVDDEDEDEEDESLQ